MTPYKLRSGNAGDTGELLRLMQQLHEDDPGAPAWDPAERESLLRPLLDDTAVGTVYVAACDDKTLLGSLILTYGYSLEFHGRHAWVDELVVDRAERGRGVGEALLRHAAATCRQQGVRAMLLEVSDANDDAARFYGRHGFAEHKRRMMSCWLDEAEI